MEKILYNLAKDVRPKRRGIIESYHPKPST